MKVSVIIPCFNEEAFIGQAIGSLLEQTRPPEEIIIVDDGSTDRSIEIARTFGTPVKVIQSGGSGASQARNEGANHAIGDALMFFDADDVLGPTAMEVLCDHLEKTAGGIVACPWYRLDKIEGKWVKSPRSCRPLVAEKDYLSGWLTGKYHPPCSILWSRTAYHKTGGWDPDVTVNQDGDLMMRALIEGIELKITVEGEAYYRRKTSEKHNVSQSSKQYSRSGRKSQIYVLRKIANLLEKRNLIHKYRKPLTEALTHTKNLCRNVYPELAEECNQLMIKYGEPKSVQVRRMFLKKVKGKIQIGLTRIAGRLSQVGLNRTQDSIARLKNIVWKTKANNKQAIKESDKPEEIKFGLLTYRKMIRN